ncbi:RHS repeat-associated core domain-containing protein [Agrobacterium sp. ES01]|uniref:RHS repeat-associated core domain-containing protein n=1 Tax=Agrobacterium sp. ES01 TaxID=3420714 RepID=UPI003D12D1C0
MRLTRIFWPLIIIIALVSTSATADIIPGKSAGQVSVTLSGSSQFSMPLAFPKGTAGMEPTLFVSYDSNSGPGNLGLGWSLTGLTQITRINRNKLIDGFPAAIDFDDPIDGFSDDGLALDGARLIAAPEGANYFSKSIDDQTRVWREGLHFVAKTKAGLTLFFGESENSRIKTVGGRTHTWAVSRILDTFGNQIVFFYFSKDGDWGPESIYWTLHDSQIAAPAIYDKTTVEGLAFASAVFQWEVPSSGPISVSFFGGQETRKSAIIDSISSFSGGREFRRYDFEYEQTARLGGRRLTAIAETGAILASGKQDSFGKTVFSYTNFDPQWNEAKLYQLPENFGDLDTVGSGFRLADIQKAGETDILYSAYVNGKAVRRSFRKKSPGWGEDSTLPPPPIDTDFSTGSLEVDPVMFFDLDADGTKDLLYSRMSQSGDQRLAYLLKGNQWTPTPNLAPPFVLVEGDARAAHVVPVSENGINKLLVWQSSGDIKVVWVENGSWQEEILGNISSPNAEFDLAAGDFSCDGKLQIVSIAKDGSTLRFHEIDRTGANASFIQVAAYSPGQGIRSVAEISSGKCSKVAMLVGQTAPSDLHVAYLSGNSVAVETNDIDQPVIGLTSELFAIDLSSSGNEAIGLHLNASIGQTNLVFAEHDGATNSWVRNSNYDYVPQSALELIDASYRLEPIEIDGQGGEDILLLPNGKGLISRALINNGAGFVVSTNLVPSIEFAQEEKVGASPQFVDINADGLTDLLAHHVDKDGKTVIRVARINTANGWAPVSDELIPPRPLTNEKSGTVGQFVDFNSDGIADLLYADGKHEDWGAWTIEFDAVGNPLRWKPAPNYILPPEAKFSDSTAGDLGVRFFDVNGDGLVDVIVSRREREANRPDFHFVALNTGSGWSGDTPKYHPPVPFVSRYRPDLEYEAKSAQADYYRDLNIQTADLNGDGTTDLLFRFGYKTIGSPLGGISILPKRDGCLNDPVTVTGSNGTPQTYEHPISSETTCAGAYYLTDPKKTGRVWVPSPNSHLFSGGNWTPNPSSHFPPLSLDLNLEQNKENASIEFVDINGDGLVDLIPAHRVGNENREKNAFLNTGKSWSAYTNYALPYEALTVDKKLTGHRLVDVNGDGLIDLLYSRPDSAQRGAYLNTGNGFASAPAAFKPQKPFFNDKGEDLGIRLVDVDGNGMPDMLESYRKKDGTFDQSAYLNSGAPDAGGFNSLEDRADMLKTVTNGMGLMTTIEYRSLLTPRGSINVSRYDFYTPSPISAPPAISHVPTMYAVRSMHYEDTDGSLIGTDYQYKGFRFDVQASSPLGFESRIAKSFVKGVGGTKAETGIVEVVELYQDYFLNGKSKHEKAIINAIVTADTKTEYLVEGGSGWPKRVVTAKTETVTRDLSTTIDPSGDPTGKTTQFFAYDQFNNAKQVCVEYGDGSRTLTDNSYDLSPDLLAPSVWFLGRLDNATVTHFRTTAAISCSDFMQGFSGVPPDERLTNTAEFRYDIRRDEAGKLLPESTGVLISETANAGHPLQVTKSYKHDKFGNVVEERAETADFPVRSKSMRYTDDGRFMRSESNALGHTVTLEYDLVLGLVTKSTDPIGIPTRTNYDSFGRAIETISATGVSSVEERDFDSSVTIGGRTSSFFTLQRTGIVSDKKFLAETKTYYDKQGRVLRVDQEGFGGKRIYQDTEYDARGRAIRTSLPYFISDACVTDTVDPCVYWSNNEYDNLDRVTKVTAPDSGTSTTDYRGLETVVSDANGKTSTKIVNEKGLTLKTIDNGKGELQFVYGPGDRLLQTIQVDGLKLVHEYDTVGNKVRSIDPDLGEWNYRYNGFGEIIWQRDAKGQVTTIAYDLLGRPLRRHMPDKLDEFAYDTSAFGIGKPATVSNSEGFEETYTYDRFGRLERKATRIHNELYSTYVEYDEFDRVAHANHPGNFTVTNEYDPQGFLARVLANDPLGAISSMPKEYWLAEERDQYGRVTSERLGNGIVSTHAYDPRKGNLAETASAKDGEGITNLAFEYDFVGNLLKKDDNVAKRFERYDYDNLDRLTGWKVNGKTEGRYEFDPSGRILSKSDIGKYVYDGNGPAHGVSRIIAPDGKEMEYAYDANGNMVSSPKGHFGYYANNSVQLIYASEGRWSRFQYAPDGSRIFQHYSETRKIGKKQTVTNIVTTVSVGAYERISDHGGAFIVKPGGFQRHRLYLSSDTGVVAVLEHSTEFDPLFSEPEFKKLKAGAALASAVAGFSAHYLHTDHLGSIIKVTDEEGFEVAGYQYDPWGKKIQTQWMAKGREDFANNTFRRGFTGHEHLDNLDLIHMNGRVYDPDIARFVSADPFVQGPGFTQGYDRYNYVYGNPIRFTDPSGYFSFGGVVGAIAGFIVGGPAGAVAGYALGDDKARKWVKENWRELVVVGVMVAVTVVTAGAACAATCSATASILVGMAAGAAGGATSAALYGGDWDDVFMATGRGAVFGGLGAAFGGALGAQIGAEYGYIAGEVAGAAGQGTVYGLQSEVSGGNFWSGFASGAITRAFMPHVKAIDNFGWRNIARAAVGGTSSAVGGGKFANGAIFATYRAMVHSAATTPTGLKILKELYSLPNTIVGLSLGAAGYAIGWGAYAVGLQSHAPQVSIVAGAIHFEYNPIMSLLSQLPGGPPAITFGSAINYRSWMWERGGDGHMLNVHEIQHVPQGHALGPWYIPSNILGGAAGLLIDGSWHGPSNWNEVGPQERQPKPWPSR